MMICVNKECVDVKSCVICLTCDSFECEIKFGFISETQTGKQVAGNHIRSQTINRAQNNNSPMGHSHQQKSCHAHQVPAAAMSDL